MTFSHGVRIAETSLDGSMRAAPTWPDLSAPILLIPATGSVFENHAYGLVLAAMEPVTWSILPLDDATYFHIDHETLILPAQDYEAGKTLFIAHLRATDAAGNSSDLTHSVTIGDEAETAPPALKFNTATNSQFLPLIFRSL